jgi:hypothetical protein
LQEKRKATILREARHNAGMIFCAEYGLHFAKEGDHWRCVEYPGVLLLSGSERYRVRERTFGSINEALRHLENFSRAGGGVSTPHFHPHLDFHEGGHYGNLASHSAR